VFIWFLLKNHTCFNGDGEEEFLIIKEESKRSDDGFFFLFYKQFFILKCHVNIFNQIANVGLAYVKWVKPKD